MTATAEPPPDAGHAATPDPADFLATTTLVEPSTWSPATTATADGGVFVAGRERMCAGLGVAASLPLPRGLEDQEALLAVRGWLGRVESVVKPSVHGDRPGGDSPAPGPVALGAFAFDRAAPTSLVVPVVTWCRDADGRIWRVDVRRRSRSENGASGAASEGIAADVATDEDVTAGAAGPDGGAADATRTPASTSAASLRPGAIQPHPPPAEYAEAVSRAVADIRAGKLRKVVLARMVTIDLPAPPVPSAILASLWGEEAVFSPFSVPTPAGRVVGASPELVIGRRGRTVTSHAFAGTVSLSASDGHGDDDGDGHDDGDGVAEAKRLFESEKDRVEHRLVVEEIVDALERRCVALTVPTEPTVVRLRSDARLGTLVRGTLTTAPAPGDTALALLALLHPTPAVGGVPRADALEKIAQLEAAPRGYWAGVVGWTDGAGDGEWVLAIRSVEIDGARARVWAGAGIVEGSDPQAELAETTFKLRPVLDALCPGASSLL